MLRSVIYIVIDSGARRFRLLYIVWYVLRPHVLLRVVFSAFWCPVPVKSLDVFDWMSVSDLLITHGKGEARWQYISITCAPRFLYAFSVQFQKRPRIYLMIKQIWGRLNFLHPFLFFQSFHGFKMVKVIRCVQTFDW